MSETGGQPAIHRSQKPGEIVPKDPDEGVSGPQMGVLCSVVPRPRREIVI